MNHSNSSHCLMPSGTPSDIILNTGDTCWRQELSHRFAVIIDAADYFRTLKSAMIKAEKCIFLIGWDFDLRIQLDPDNKTDDWPDKLGDFINALVDRKPELEIRLLKWDLGTVKTLVRGATPLVLLGWMAKPRVHFRLDHCHPIGACHHQKIVVIDDAFAICGGIDVTVGRWDTPAHLGKDKRRNSPWGFAQGPWHDATAAVDGEAAVALGVLARERWHLATDETLPPPEPGRDPWPSRLAPSMTEVMVGIARTQPDFQNQKAAHEIEKLYVAAIRSARRVIYIESQYCASQRIAEALAARLRETAGPEIVIVNPESADGWLEEEVMGAARALVVDMLRGADHENRFRLYFPIAADGTPIYVHAKIMVIDDRLLKVGSSNLNNRSMGFDTECDLAIELAPGDPNGKSISAAITGIMHGLLAEHLDADPDELATALNKGGGALIPIIEHFAAKSGRTLKQLETPRLNDAEKLLAEKHILDPERPGQLLPKLKRMLP